VEAEATMKHPHQYVDAVLDFEQEPSSRSIAVQPGPPALETVPLDPDPPGPAPQGPEALDRP
jgi:hypothetical protein